MAMKILKVSSIFNNRNPNQFLNDLRRKTQINIEEFDHVRALHVEHLRNERYHLRIYIDNKDLIEKLIKESELNHDQKSYTLRFAAFTYLFMTPEQSEEKFYIEHSNARSNKVLKIRKLENQNLLDILNKLVRMGCKDLQYVSTNNSHAFVGFTDEREAKSIKFKLLKEKFDVEYAKSVLKVIKFKSSFKIQQGVSNRITKTINTSKNIYKGSVKKKDLKKNNKRPIKHLSKITKHQQSRPSTDTQVMNSQQVINVPYFYPNNTISMRPPMISTISGHPSMPRQINMFRNPVNMIQHPIPLCNNLLTNNVVHNNSLPNSLSYNDYNYIVYPTQFM